MRFRPSATPSASAGTSSACRSIGCRSDFSATREAVRLIWNLQFALILGAHLLAVVLGLATGGRRTPLAHLPMTVLMVLYTVLGLWLLSTPTGA